MELVNEIKEDGEEDQSLGQQLEVLREGFCLFLAVVVRLFCREEEIYNLVQREEIIKGVEVLIEQEEKKWRGSE